MLSVIFDMDGVIFDTEMLCRKAWHSMEEEYGISAEKMDQLLILCVGTNRAHMVKTFLEQLGNDFPVERFLDESMDRIAALGASGLDDFDEALVRYMRKKHNLLIGERTAEDIKIKIGTCYPLAQNETMDVRGRNLVTGLPRTITVSSEETEEALREPTLQIVEAVHSVLEKTPPELAADVADRGIVLTGGGALLRGLEELIEERTGINTMTAEHPMTCVAIGTGKYVEFLAGKRDDD